MESISTSPGLPGNLPSWGVTGSSWDARGCFSHLEWCKGSEDNRKILPLCRNFYLPRAPSRLGSNREEMPHVSCSRMPQWPQAVSRENFKQKPASLPAAEPNPKLKECVTKLPKVWHLAALPAAFYYFPSSPQSICDVSKGHSLSSCWPFPTATAWKDSWLLQASLG